MGVERVRLRRDVAAIVPYRQGRAAAADAFKLSSNENPFPPLPSVVEAVASSPVNRYPEGSAQRVRDRLGGLWRVSPEEIHVGPGSVSVIGNLITATSAPGDEVVFAWKSFEAYPVLAGAAGATAVRVPNTPDERHDIPGILAAVTDRTRLVFLCTPNNPTSTFITRDEFEWFMARVPRTVLVVLDEAYTEFVTDPESVKGEEVLARHPNLVVLRTFSKAYGLAGLRIGYAVGPEYVMDALRAVSVPLAVTDLAQRAALASLDHEDELLERVAVIAERRDRVRSALIDQGWPVPEAQGNFVWLPTGDATQEVADAFERDGVVVRPIADGLRVSIGEEEAVDRLLRSSGEVVAMLRSRAPVSG